MQQLRRKSGTQCAGSNASSPRSASAYPQQPSHFIRPDRLAQVRIPLGAPLASLGGAAAGAAVAASAASFECLGDAGPTLAIACVVASALLRELVVGGSQKGALRRFTEAAVISVGAAELVRGGVVGMSHYRADAPGLSYREGLIDDLQQRGEALLAEYPQGKKDYLETQWAPGWLGEWGVGRQPWCDRIASHYHKNFNYDPSQPDAKPEPKTGLALIRAKCLDAKLYNPQPNDPIRVKAGVDQRTRDTLEVCDELYHERIPRTARTDAAIAACSELWNDDAIRDYTDKGVDAWPRRERQ